MSLIRLFLTALAMLACIVSYAQEDSVWHNLRKRSSQKLHKAETVSTKTDSVLQSIQDIPNRYIKEVDQKIDKYSDRITGKTERTLVKLSRWEDKIRGLLQKVSPETTERLFSNQQLTFSSALQKYKEGKTITDGYKAQYDQYRDKLTTSIKYIQSQKVKLDSAYLKPLANTSDKLNELEENVANAEALQKFIKERKKLLIDECAKYIGKSKYLSKINKESYYYVETLRNYKEIFSDSKKAEETAIAILNKIPAFNDFVRKNSMLSSLFRNSSGSGEPQSIVGLQTIASVNALIEDRLQSGGPNARELFSQNIQQAQAEMHNLKERVLKAGAGSSDGDMPDFKPNDQKSKTFLQRLEFGSNFQTVKGNGLLPATTDIALSIGYKINDKSIIGIGGSYKVGLGTIDHIKISHQGIGLRSFVDYKIKKQFFLSGGYEMNYNAQFKNFYQLGNLDSWQQAGLLGISKVIKLKTKLVKGTKLQMLYDILHRQHIPATQALIFRVGYQF